MWIFVVCLQFIALFVVIKLLSILSNIYSLVLMSCIKVSAACDSTMSMWSHLCLDENFYLFSIYLFIYNRSLLRPLKIFFWCMVDLWCCVNFRHIAKWIYYTFTHFLKDSFFILHEHWVHVYIFKYFAFWLILQMNCPLENNFYFSLSESLGAKSRYDVPAPTDLWCLGPLLWLAQAILSFLF